MCVQNCDSNRLNKNVNNNNKNVQLSVIQHFIPKTGKKNISPFETQGIYLGQLVSDSPVPPLLLSCRWWLQSGCFHQSGNLQSLQIASKLSTHNILVTLQNKPCAITESNLSRVICHFKYLMSHYKTNRKWHLSVLRCYCFTTNFFKELILTVTFTVRLHEC